MSNRHARRAAEKLRQARRNTDDVSRQARLQAAQSECSRLGGMYQCAQQALQLAAAIPDVPKPEGWTAEDGEPNFFKLAALEDFMERLTETRVELIAAHEELYLAAAGLVADSAIVVPKSIVTT